MTAPRHRQLSDLDIWRSYLVAQLAHACLGLIPENALAIGVEVLGEGVLLRFVMTEMTDQTREDIDDILDAFGILVGPRVGIAVERSTTDGRSPIPNDDQTDWTYKASR